MEFLHNNVKNEADIYIYTYIYDKPVVIQTFVWHLHVLKHTYNFMHNSLFLQNYEIFNAYHKII